MRIITYNTRGSRGMDNRRDTPRIARTMRALSPDIVCFQEIHQRLPWSGREDQPVLLAQELGRQFVFQSNVRFGFGNYGVGIALRGTVMEKREHLLPSGKEQRGALELRLRNVAGFPRLTVFCTHWGLESDERLRQGEALAALIESAPRPLLVCGDFNERIDSPGLSAMVMAAGLIDADGQHNRNTFVADNPRERIDYILYSPDLSVQNIEVVSTLASDHLPVLADVAPISR